MILGINCGGSATGSWVADEDFSGGTANTVTNTINTANVTNPAPVAVYQTNRFGTCSYTIGGLSANTAYTVRLHFCETYWDAAGDRTFNVTVNSTQVLTNFDMFAAAGGENIANIQQYTATTNASGQILIGLTTVIDNAQINGIEIDSTTGSAPSAPTGLTATGGNVQVLLSWTASSGATSYNVYRGTASGGESATAIATGVTAATYTDTNVTNGTAYYYKAAAVNSYGTSAQSAEASATPQASVPAAPTGLTATAGNAQIALSWTASSGATSYNVYRGTASGGESATAIATGITASSYTNTGLTNGTPYYYKVAALNASGTSALSTEATATPSAGTGTMILGINCGGSATGSWVADEDFSGGTANSVTNTINTANVTNPAPVAVYQTNRYATCSYTVGGLTANASYTVRLHFCETFWDAAGDRTFDVTINSTQVLTNFDMFATAGGENIANIQQFTATANASGQILIGFTTVIDNAQINGIEIDSTSGGSAPSAPTNLTATAGSTQVALAWTASSGATSYNLYEGTATGAEGATPVATGITATSYTATGLTNGTPYYFTVAAVNASGTSSKSNEASATPVSGVPSAPTALTATAGNTQVALSWTAGTGATTYNVYEGTATGSEGAAPVATGVTATSYTDTGLTNGTAYFFKVAGVDSSGTSAQSNEASATPVSSTLSAPTGLSAAGTNAQVALSWTGSTGATSYDVYRGTASGGESATPIATGVTATSYSNTGLTNGTTYYYTVAAVNSSATSPASNEASATPEVLVSSGYVPGGYTLQWNDEFNQGVGSPPNADNWNYDTGIGPNNDGWGNWEQQTYVSDLAHCQIIADPLATDGQALQIQATNDGDWTTYDYHSARIQTIGKVLPEYGYIELRAKLPSTQGIWPSFWMLGNDINSIGWPNCGEMDIMEMFGQDPTSEFSSYHMGSSTDTEINWTDTYTSSTYQSAYHVFGLLWTPTGVTNYIDGNEFETYPSSTQGWVFNQPFYMLLDLAVGGIPPGDVVEGTTVFPQNLDIDYIRIYEPGTGAPTGLYANPGAAQVSLTWTPTVGPSTYKVYRGTTSGGESATPIATGVTTAAYIDTAVTNGVTYYYTVAAVTVDGATPQSTEASAEPINAPNFGPNVLIFTPSMNQTEVQTAINYVYNQQVTNEFGTSRYALLFAPGSYNLDVPVGFYTQVLGLGSLPTSTTINGYVEVNAEWNYTNATDNFWRSVENLNINPTDSDGTQGGGAGAGVAEYAVSQACPMRRCQVDGDLLLADEDWLPTAPGWASGGFVADCNITDEVEPISQQQFFFRNNSFSSCSNSVWNTVFVGDTGAPATSWPDATDDPAVNPYTTIADTPVVREKPYLNVDSSGNYWVFVPSLRSNVQGTSWSGGTEAGTNISISDFYIAHSNTDNATTINAALNSGLNILFTPGVYALGGTIQVNNANTVLLGLGLATLQANTGATAIQVADVAGVTVAGLLIESSSNVGTLMEVGPTGASANNSANPILLSDLFFRIGGDVVGTATTTLEINSNYVIGDDFWLWRADHGLAGTVGWTVNTATNGLVVNGSNFSMYGLAVEHFEGYQSWWNGNGGQTYFYQSEAPYDVPDQAAWMDGTTDGFASYKVSSTVTSHAAYGVGIYCYFDVDPSGVILQNAIEAPSVSGVTFTDMLIDSLGGEGTIDSVINGIGGPVANNGGTANENYFLATP
ncbi:MAG: malectin domain-containing carbohydrate-binding protein [Capsulimonadaceae bacterium]